MYKNYFIQVILIHKIIYLRLQIYLFMKNYPDGVKKKLFHKV